MTYSIQLSLITILFFVLSCTSQSTVTDPMSDEVQAVDQNTTDEIVIQPDMDSMSSNTHMEATVDSNVQEMHSTQDTDIPQYHDRALPPGTHRQSLTHDMLDREYILHIPTNIDVTHPIALVLCFHGYTSSANTIMTYSKFNQLADQENFIVVYPQGSLFRGRTHWSVGGWTFGSTADDLGFIDVLLNELSSIYHIDQQRIYSTGMSNGGYMSFLLACRYSQKIAAIASITGSMTPQMYRACQPEHPMPILQIHGDADSVVPYEGDPSWTYSIPEVLRYWNEWNQNVNPPQVMMIEDINTDDGSTVEHYIYTNDQTQINVEHYKVIGGDHDWPGAWGNKDLDTTRMIWKFFKQYTLQGRVE